MSVINNLPQGGGGNGLLKQIKQVSASEGNHGTIDAASCNETYVFKASDGTKFVSYDSACLGLYLVNDKLESTQLVSVGYKYSNAVETENYVFIYSAADVTNCYRWDKRTRTISASVSSEGYPLYECFYEDADGTLQNCYKSSKWQLCWTDASTKAVTVYGQGYYYVGKSQTGFFVRYWVDSTCGIGHIRKSDKKLVSLSDTNIYDIYGKYLDRLLECENGIAIATSHAIANRLTNDVPLITIDTVNNTVTASTTVLGTGVTYMYETSTHYYIGEVQNSITSGTMHMISKADGTDTATAYNAVHAHKLKDGWLLYGVSNYVYFMSEDMQTITQISSTISLLRNGVYGAPETAFYDYGDDYIICVPDTPGIYYYRSATHTISALGVTETSTTSAFTTTTVTTKPNKGYPSNYLFAADGESAYVIVRPTTAVKQGTKTTTTTGKPKIIRQRISDGTVLAEFTMPKESDDNGNIPSELIAGDNGDVFVIAYRGIYLITADNNMRLLRSENQTYMMQNFSVVTNGAEQIAPVYKGDLILVALLYTGSSGNIWTELITINKRTYDIAWAISNTQQSSMAENIVGYHYYKIWATL